VLLEIERPLNIDAVLVFRATARAFFKEACPNQIRSDSLNHIKPDPRRVCIDKVGLAAPNYLISLVTHNIG
jgi:hypothetical protein